MKKIIENSKATLKKNVKIYPPVVKPCFKFSFVHNAWHLSCDIYYPPSVALLSWHL